MDIGSFTPPIGDLGFFFFFFPAVDCCGVLACGFGSFTPPMVVSRCRSEIWVFFFFFPAVNWWPVVVVVVDLWVRFGLSFFFFFLLWTGGRWWLWICGFDLGWCFFFFFLLSCCGLVAGGGGGGCLCCGGGGDILFYCSKNIILL